MSLILKIVPRSLWQAAEAAGRFEGAPIDLADGYIHFSSPAQVVETAAKHFAGQDDLLVVGVASDVLGDALKWEASRGDALFPHLHAPLALADVLWVKPLPLGDDGRHVFAGLIP